MLLLSSVNEHLQAILKFIPGRIKDVETLRTTIEDPKIEKITFIFEKDFFFQKKTLKLFTNLI